MLHLLIDLAQAFALRFRPDEQPMLDIVGLGLNTMYQLMWTLPQWDGLVVNHMAKHDTPGWYAAALLLAFGAIFHVHR